MFRLKNRHRRVLACVTAVALSACNDSTPPDAPQVTTPPPSVTLAPLRLVPLAGTGQAVPAGASLPGLLYVAVDDSTGQWMSGVGVVFTVTGGGGAISGDTAFTNFWGVAASGPWTLGTAGPQTVTAKLGSLTATFTATALPPDLTPLTSPDTSGAATGNVSGRLAFVRDDTVFVSDIDGTNATVLRSLPSHARAATATAVSPDRSQVAFLNASSTDICVASTAGTDVRCAGLQGYHNLTGLAWSPDGRRLAFIGPLDVECTELPFPCASDMTDAMVLDATTIGRVLAQPVFAGMDNTTSVAWSPDGQRLALAVRGKGIYLIDAVVREAQRVYYRSDLTDMTGVRWSPDGKSLALTIQFSPCNQLCDMGIAVVHLDGTGFRLLERSREGPDRFIFASSWSPDGSSVAYGAVDCSRGSDPCREDVFVVGAAGGPSRVLLSNAELLGWWP